MSQGHAAIALHRLGRLNEAKGIVASLIERSVVDEQGMHWNDANSGWWWHQAPIETQAMMIEVLDEVAGDLQRVELCQAWLLRQKETQSWETTKSTADAVYALLLRGTDKLASDEVVDIAVGQQEVPKGNVEAGTGFYQHRFSADEITPEMGSIQVKKTTSGIAWGGVHWQYFENIENITPHDGTPLQIEKQLFVVRATDSGPVLRPIGDEPVRVGDELVSRLIIRSDRDMEFLHLRDHRVPIPSARCVGVLPKHSRRGRAFLHWLPVQGNLCVGIPLPCAASRELSDWNGKHRIDVCTSVQQPQRKPCT